MNSHHSWDLAFEFPELKEKIHNLKMTNKHFERLLTEYTEIGKAIHRAETRVDLISEVAEEELRRKRLHCKDELYKMLEG